MNRLTLAATLALAAIDAVTTREQLIDLFARNHGGIGLRPIAVSVDMDRNIDAWHRAFDVQPQDKLYLAPADRVSLW